MLDEEIVVQLVNSHSYSKENAEAMKKEVLHLLNYVPFSYSVKDNYLETASAVQFEVTNASSRYSMEQCRFLYTVIM